MRRPISLEDHIADSRVDLGNPVPLRFRTPLGEQYGIVRCLHKRHQILVQHVPLVPSSQKDEQVLQKLGEDSRAGPTAKINVLMIGLDSISNLNFERHLPRTKVFLKDVLRAVQLHGYTKIGDTFPNVIALLTGHFLEHYWNQTMTHFTSDGLDFVWKEFAQRGYRTLFAEDAPDIATINYLKNGFARPPTTYYLRPLCLPAEGSVVWSIFSPHCWGSKMEMVVVFDYLADFVEASDSNPHFWFAFTARLVHDHLNNAGYADAPPQETPRHRCTPQHPSHLLQRPWPAVRQHPHNLRGET